MRYKLTLRDYQAARGIKEEDDELLSHGVGVACRCRIGRTENRCCFGYPTGDIIAGTAMW